MGSRGSASAARLLFFLFSGALAGCAGGSAASGSVPGAATDATPTDAAPAPAVFTAEQAERGRRVFARVCSVCHGRNEFRGPIFTVTWVAEPVGYLFQHISTTMPQDRPGSLSVEQYASIVAYFLELNGRPAGDRELPADAEALNRLRW